MNNKLAFILLFLYFVSSNNTPKTNQNRMLKLCVSGVSGIDKNINYVKIRLYLFPNLVFLIQNFTKKHYV